MDNSDDRNELVRTTVFLTRKMHESAKIMAIVTRSSVSQIIRVALQEKLNKLKDQQ